MRTRSVISASIAAWAIALPWPATATAGTAQQEKETIELQKVPMAAQEEKVEPERLPTAEVVQEVPPRILTRLVPLPGSSTTVFVVRHAEDYAPCPADAPWGSADCLSAEGRARALQLLQIMKVLEPAKPIAVYSTQVNRTWQTAQPTAEHFGVDISPYAQPLEVANTILQEQIGKRVLVVGHQPTVGQIVENLGAPQGSCAIGDEYDNLCIVALSGTQFAGFARLRYEAPPPQPDLVVAALRRSPLQPRAGDTVTFTATVKNVGAADAGACKLSQQASWMSQPKIFSLPALASGQSHSVAYRVGGAVAGRQHVVAEVDPQGSVQESDESNNRRRSYFDVQPSDELPVRCRTALDCGRVSLWSCCEGFCVKGRCP